MRRFLTLTLLATACGGGTSPDAAPGSTIDGAPGSVTDAAPATGDAAAAAGGCSIFPANNWWNRDIYDDEVDPQSDAYVRSIGLDAPLHADYGSIYGIPYVYVDADTPRSRVRFRYDDQSDPGPYPIPLDPPIEDGSDRHILMIEQSECVLYEIFAANLDETGWSAGSGAIWDLKQNSVRPDTWTSADAAGLPIFPGLVRYDEVVEQHAIRHALRFTAERTRGEYIFPASHQASDITDANVPPMGIRVRLKRGVDISGYPPESRVVLEALKHYGMFLADNGSNWYITGAPDERWNDDAVTAIRMLHGRDLEVVKPEQRP